MYSLEHRKITEAITMLAHYIRKTNTHIEIMYGGSNYEKALSELPYSETVDFLVIWYYYESDLLSNLSTMKHRKAMNIRLSPKTYLQMEELKKFFSKGSYNAVISESIDRSFKRMLRQISRNLF